MTELFIKYNPYTLETLIKINGEELRANSKFKIKDTRLQEWIENLPDMLDEECNDSDYLIKFHGLSSDFEDLQYVASSDEVKNAGLIINCEHVNASASDINSDGQALNKETAIKAIFKDIQNGPFDELRQPDVVNAFEEATGDVFPINVIATMSSGKSTLINALLARKLMPSKQEACTATITEIKDCARDDGVFTAKVFDKEGHLIEEIEDLDYETMQRLNDNPNVSEIDVEGKIPFIKSDSNNTNSLVLVDTPGPNNSRDAGHKAATYKMISSSSKTLVLYILNASQFAINDDNALLSDVAKSMEVGGKQSKDRFIFVLNKIDNFNPKEDSVKSLMDKAKEYLEKQGINNPKIFPASALAALNIRTILKDVDLKNLDIDALDDEASLAALTCRKLNRNEDLHLENYAFMPQSIRRDIKKLLNQAKENHDGKTEALIHSGIISVEAYIKLYIEKYARTAKIKSMTDTFTQKIENLQSIEKVKVEIASNKDSARDIKAKIDKIKKKLSSGKEAREFERNINNIDYSKEIAIIVKNINKEAQDQITEKLEASRGRLDKNQAANLVNKLKNFADSLLAKVRVRLEEAIETHINNNANAQLERYKNKLAELAEDLNVGDVKLRPLEIAESFININSDNLIKNTTQSERVKDGSHWVKNPDKHWYNPFTWFDESGWWVDDYKTVEFIEGYELAQKILVKVQENLADNIDSAVKYAGKQAQELKEQFKLKFKELDDALARKLDELNKYADDQTKTENKIAELEKEMKRLEWLENIKKRVYATLEI